MCVYEYIFVHICVCMCVCLCSVRRLFRLPRGLCFEVNDVRLQQQVCTERKTSKRDIVQQAFGESQ